MAIIVIILIGMVLFLSKEYIQRLEPAGIFALMWSLMIGAILLCHDFVIIHYYGFIFILACVFCFTIGTIFCDTCYLPQQTDKTFTIQFHRQRAKIILGLLLIAAFFNPIYTLYLHGFSLSSLLSTAALLYMNSEMSMDRYYGDNAYSIVNQIFLVFSYTAPLWGGFCYRLMDKYGKVICFLTIFPSIFIALTQAVKLAMVTSIILWIAGFLVCSHSYGLSLKIRFQKLLLIIVSVIGLFAILFVSMILRTGEISERIVEDITNKFFSYALGSVPSFDIWFSIGEQPTDLTYGGKTFYGITNFLGIMNRIQGVYDQWVVFGKNGFKGEGNVYTAFRMMVEDFGPAISCILFIGLGFLAKLSFKKLKIGSFPSFHQTFAMAIYAYILLSFASSIFAYTSYLVMFALTFFILSYVQTTKEVSA